MQTFITYYNDFEQSARSLWENGVQSNRLQNQINEGLIILRTLTGWYTKRGRKGWPYHPATKMWAGYETLLFKYIITHIRVYELLSGNDCSERLNDLEDAGHWVFEDKAPTWLTEEFSSNHRAILLGKAVEKTEIEFDKWHNAKNRKQELSAERKLEKAQQVLSWYQSFNWAEQPAEKVDGKWPYLWPGGVE